MSGCPSVWSPICVASGQNQRRTRGKSPNLDKNILRVISANGFNEFLRNIFAWEKNLRAQLNDPIISKKPMWWYSSDQNAFWSSLWPEGTIKRLADHHNHHSNNYLLVNLFHFRPWILLWLLEPVGQFCVKSTQST